MNMKHSCKIFKKSLNYFIRLCYNTITKDMLFAVKSKKYTQNDIY